MDNWTCHANDLLYQTHAHTNDLINHPRTNQLDTTCKQPFLSNTHALTSWTRRANDVPVQQFDARPVIGAWTRLAVLGSSSQRVAVKPGRASLAITSLKDDYSRVGISEKPSDDKQQ